MEIELGDRFGIYRVECGRLVEVFSRDGIRRGADEICVAIEGGLG